MWLQTYALTSLFFLVATGVGLLILVPVSKALFKSKAITRSQLLALGFVLGAPAAGTFLQLLSLSTHNLQIDLTLMLLGASMGWLLSVKLWRPRSEDLSEIAVWTALSIPLALVTWWWTFGAFSDFPFTDIGADVHWLKIAQEFSDSGALNPYANQTYTDIRAALAGLLAGSLGLDLLQFNWAYRFLSILYLLVVFYAFADAIFLDRRRKWIAFFLAGATNTLGLMTNGSLALAGSALLLAVLIRLTAKQPSPGPEPAEPVLWPTVGAMLVILLAYILNNNALTLALVCAIPIAHYVLSWSGHLSGPTAIRTLTSVVWSATLIFVHRGSYLFIPAAIAGWIFYLAVQKAPFAERPLVLRAAWIATLLLPAVGAICLGCILIARLGYLPKLDANALFSHITMVFFGTPIKPQDEISLGIGPEIAAIEVGRALGPFFAVCIGLVFAYWWIANPPSRLATVMENRQQRENITRLFWSWTAGCGLGLVVLSGFPFLYRIMFVISCYFTIATTELIAQLIFDPVSGLQKKQRIAALATLAITILAAAIYSINWSNHPYGGYQAMLRPAFISAAVLVLMFAALSLFRSRSAAAAGLVAAIGLAIAIDRAGIATMFKAYSYGRLPDAATAISHYDDNDLDINRWLRKNIPRALVVSDPYTLGLTKAMTGLPGIYLFSNLDTVNEAVATRIKAVISGIIDPSPDNSSRVLHTCALISPLLLDLNREALFQLDKTVSMQGIFKPVRRKTLESDIEPKDVNDAETKMTGSSVARAVELLKAPEGTWNVVAIINPRTIQWLRLSDQQRLSYYPVQEPLDREIPGSLKAGPFPVLFSAGQSFIVSISCDTIAKQ